MTQLRPIVLDVHTPPPPEPGYGTLSLEIWNDGTDVQVIGLDAEGRIVLAREGRMSSEPTLEGTGGIEGILPAEQLSFDSDGTLKHERCATPSCARRIATMAESIVRASTMGAVEGAGILGFKYATGLGIRENAAEAVRWFPGRPAQGRHPRTRPVQGSGRAVRPLPPQSPRIR